MISEAIEEINNEANEFDTEDTDWLQESDTDVEPEKADADEQDEDEEEVPEFIDEKNEIDEEDSGSGVIRQMRRERKEALRKNKELERQIEELKKPPAIEHPGTKTLAKPTLADCDWDTDEYEARILSWNTLTMERVAEEAREAELRKIDQQKWHDITEKYNAGKKALGIADYADSEAEVADTLSVTQQGIILKYVTDPEKMIYALGKSEKKLKELQAITDNIEFALQIKALEEKLKMTKRTTTKPESKVLVGSTGGKGGNTATLKALQDKAEQTGDYTNVVAYMSAQKKK